MCCSFTLIIAPEALAKAFNLKEIPDIEPRYNISPSQSVISIRHAGDHNKLDYLKWGLLPGRFEDVGITPIIARSETVHEMTTFQHAIKYSRCIIPASGFFEWLPKDDFTQPYYIRLNSSFVGFAGLWEKRKADDGTEIETCCILTTAANEVVKPINDRMPVILKPEDYNLWLDKSIYDSNELQRLYKPYSSALMVAYKVPDLVNNPRFDSAACIVRV